MQQSSSAQLTSCCAVLQFGEVRQTGAMPGAVDLTADSPTGASEGYERAQEKYMWSACWLLLLSDMQRILQCLEACAMGLRWSQILFLYTSNVSILCTCEAHLLAPHRLFGDVAALPYGDVQQW